MTSVVQTGPIIPVVYNRDPLTIPQRAYYWHIRNLIDTRTTSSVLYLKAKDLQVSSSDPNRDLRIAVDHLLYDQHLLKSFAMAQDHETLMLQVGEKDTYDSALPPMTAWFSPSSPSNRMGEPIPTSASTQASHFTHAQLRYLSYVHSCMAERRPEDKQVLRLNPYAIATDSPSPLQDMQRVITYMVDEEKSILGFACDRTSQFYVWLTKEDIQRSDYVGEPLQWFSTGHLPSADLFSDKKDAQPDRPKIKETPATPLPEVKQKCEEELKKLLSEEKNIWTGSHIKNLVAKMDSLPDLEPITVYLKIFEAFWLDKEACGQLKPRVLTALVQKAFLQPEKNYMIGDFLNKVAGAISVDASLHAFVEGLPSSQDCPLFFTGYNYYNRQDALSDRSKTDHPDHGHYLRGQLALSLLAMENVKALLKKLPQDDLKIAIESLFGYAARVSTQVKEILEAVDQLPVTGQRFALEPLPCMRDAESLAWICFHQVADQALMDRILALHPGDKKEQCKSTEDQETFTRQPDPFFYSFSKDIVDLSTQHNSSQVLQWLIASVYTTSNPEREKILLDTLMDRHKAVPASLLAPCLYLFPPEGLKKLLNGIFIAKPLIELAHEFMVLPPSTQTEAILEALALKVGNAPDLSQAHIKDYFAILTDLQAQGNFDLFLNLFRALDENERSSRIAVLFSKVPSSTWQIAGEYFNDGQSQRLRTRIEQAANSLPEAYGAFKKGWTEGTPNQKGIQHREADRAYSERVNYALVEMSKRMGGVKDQEPSSKDP